MEVCVIAFFRDLEHCFFEDEFFLGVSDIERVAIHEKSVVVRTGGQRGELFIDPFQGQIASDDTDEARSVAFLRPDGARERNHQDIFPAVGGTPDGFPLLFGEGKPRFFPVGERGDFDVIKISIAQGAVVASEGVGRAVLPWVNWRKAWGKSDANAKDFFVFEEDLFL